MKAMYIAPVQLATSKKPDLTIGLIYPVKIYSFNRGDNGMREITCNDTVEKIYLTSDEFETAFRIIP